MKTFILPSSVAGAMLFNLAAQAALPDQITGTVRDTNGAPAVGVEVKLIPEWMSEPIAKTDSNGRFQIKTRSLSTGQNYTPFLIIRDLDHNLTAVRDIQEETNKYDLQLVPGVSISGRVQNEQSKPLTNASVRVYVWSGNSGFSIQNSDSAKSDADGRFKVPVLPVGRRYSVDVSAKGYGSGSSSVQESDSSGLEFPPFSLKVADQKIAGIILDSEQKPVKGAQVYIYGQGQPNTTVHSDENGRFAVDEVCEGTITINASISGTNFSFGDTRAQGGDTNIVVTLGPQGSGSQPRRASLVGKPLPELTTAGIPVDALGTNKPLLICLFDPEQRPSRRALRILGEQNDALKQKGVMVVGISAALTTADALKEWKQSNPQPFPIGAVTEKTGKTKWLLNTEKFPWLILTDAQGRVKAEGFDLEDLDAKIK